MEISKTLRPGEMGTKRFLNEYGNQLICVRYRIDKQQQKRFTTIELIADERPYISNKAIVYVWLKISFEEAELRQQAKMKGARWIAEQKVWEMRYEAAEALGLKKRIMTRTVKEGG